VELAAGIVAQGSSLCVGMQREDDINALLLKMGQQPAAAAPVVAAATAGLPLESDKAAVGPIADGGTAAGNTAAAKAEGGTPASLVATAAAVTAETSGASRVLLEVSRRLAGVLREQQRSISMSGCMQAARALRLHLGGPSTRTINAFQQQYPW
jgi:hypothetical protein